ncbi:24547_t:CDS:1, partial [Dentiscutata erythropus]
KTQKQEDSWDNFCEKVESWPSSSTDDKEDSFENSLPTVEFESQFSVLELKFYTRYEEYLDDVRRENPKKYQKYRMWFNFFNAHARSYHNLFNEGVNYYNIDSWEIVEHRREFYELDFEFVIKFLNKKLKHIYLLDYDDLLEYAENNLVF